jgi:ATP-binding cassette subfamily C protein LapB
MNVYDRIIPHQATATLWALAFGLIFVYIFDFILKTLRAYFLDSVGKVADVRLSKSLMQHLLSINLQKKT